MADEPKAGTGFSLRRWSQRKHESARGTPPATPSGDDSTTPLSGALPVPAAAAVVVAAPMSAHVAAAPSSADPVALPPVETLTFDSDFAAFMQPKVEEATRRAALKKLFGDPSFNVMDGLDIYVGDYTQPDPMPAGMLEKLANVYGLLDPIATDPQIVASQNKPDDLLPADLPEAGKVGEAAPSLPAPGDDAPEGPPIVPADAPARAAEDVAHADAKNADGDPERA
jgi:hypothetical protein